MAESISSIIRLHVYCWFMRKLWRWSYRLFNWIEDRSLSESRDAPCSVSEGQIVHMKCCINQFKVLSVSQYSLHLGCGRFSWIGTWDDFERDFKKPN